jgi:hypothetical protein
MTLRTVFRETLSSGQIDLIDFPLHEKRPADLRQFRPHESWKPLWTLYPGVPTRNGFDWSDRYPSIEAVAALLLAVADVPFLRSLIQRLLK